MLKKLLSIYTKIISSQNSIYIPTLKKLERITIYETYWNEKPYTNVSSTNPYPLLQQMKTINPHSLSFTLSLGRETICRLTCSFSLAGKKDDNRPPNTVPHPPNHSAARLWNKKQREDGRECRRCPRQLPHIHILRVVRRRSLSAMSGARRYVNCQTHVGQCVLSPRAISDPWLVFPGCWSVYM